MPPQVSNNPLTALIDTPAKARAIKKYLDSTDITTLSYEDRQGFNLARQALGRWVNPMPKAPGADIYNYPREQGDVIRNQMSREPVTEISPDRIRDTDPTMGEHIGAGFKGLADLVGIPTSGEEWKREFSPRNLAITTFGPAAPFIKQGINTYEKAKSGVGLSGEDTPIVGPMIVDPVKKLSRPVRAVAENRPPTRQESLEATRSGTSLATALALTPKSVRYAEAGGLNPILDPRRTVTRSIARAETQVPKITDKIRQKHDPAYAGRAHEAADVADALAADVRPTAAATTGSQARARTSVRMSDAAVGTAKGARKMAKSEKTFDLNAPDQINRRLATVLDDVDTRLARGDNPGAEALRPDRYRKGIPRNPEIIKADKLKLHQETQTRLQQPDMQAIDVPEPVTINYILKDALKKAHAIVGDSPKSNKHLRDIVERSNRSGELTLEDYNVLRDMTDGNYIVGYGKSGKPIMKSIEMPQMLSDGVGYIERLRRENSGKLPSRPHELNQAKANRYDEIPDRTFDSELTDADKAMNTVRRGQAMGLRRLVDEVTAGPDGRSQITELNRSYANLAALESGIRNYNLSDRLTAPLPPIAMAGGGSASMSGVVRAATGTGVLATITRPIRSALISPAAGRRFALATETLGRLRGLKPPPPKSGAQPPPPGGNIPTGPTGPVSPRPFGTGPGPGPVRGPATVAPGVAPSAPQQAKPPKSGKTATAATSGPPVPAAAGQSPLAKQAFHHARVGELRKLDELWKANQVQLRKEMRPSDVKWVESKLQRYHKNKATKASQKPPQVVSEKPAPHEPADFAPSPEMESVRSDVRKAIASMESAGLKVPEHLKKIAQLDEPITPSDAQVPVPSAPARPPKREIATVQIDQLGTDRIKGDWREVKTLEQTRPKPTAPVAPERPSGKVATEDWYFDDLPLQAVERKITELSVVHDNAIKRGNDALADRTLRMLTDAQRVRADRQAGKRPIKRPVADIDDILSETDAELAAAELDAGASVVEGAASHAAKPRLRIQAIMDKAAELMKSKDPEDLKRAEALLDEATRLADELEQK